MPSFAERVGADMVTAMKQRQELPLAVLRMLKAALQLAQVEAGKGNSLSDDDCVVIVQRLIKQRREAASAYSAGGADERAHRELEEAAFLEQYLPQQLSDGELMEIVRGAAEECGGNMGKLMGKVMPLVKGKADGNRVKAAAEAVLAG